MNLSKALKGMATEPRGSFFFFFFKKRAFRLERTASAKALRQECFCVSSQESWGRDQRGVNRREAAVSRGGWERPRGVKDGGAEN